jgi:hypothetical protein
MGPCNNKHLGDRDDDVSQLTFQLNPSYAPAEVFDGMKRLTCV